MITFIDNTKDPKDPTQCNQQLAEGYIRSAFNNKLQSLNDLVQIKQFLSDKISGRPSKQELLLQKIDPLLLKFVNQILSNRQDISRYEVIGNISEIVRIHRDLLFDSQSRQNRLVAGIREQLNKAYHNQIFQRAYI